MIEWLLAVSEFLYHGFEQVKCRMKRQLFALCLAILLYQPLWGQQQSDLDQSSVHLIFLQQGYVVGALSGLGVAGCNFTTIATIGASNPAMLKDFSHFAIGIAVQYDSPLKPAWLVGIAHERDPGCQPQSAGLVFPFRNFRFGADFCQKYNSILDFGEMKLVSLSHPEGTGETFHPKQETVVFAYSAALSYSPTKSLSSHRVTFGIRYGWHHLRHSATLWHAEVKANATRGRWSAGLEYERKRSLETCLRMGFFSESPLNIEARPSITGLLVSTSSDLPVNPSGARQPIFIESSLPLKTVAKLPARIHLGVSFKTSGPWVFSFELEHIDWHQSSSTSKNQTNFTGSVIFKPFRWITTSYGFYMLNRHFTPEINRFFEVEGKLRAFFITFGSIIHLQHFDFEFAFGSSKNPGSGEWYRQNILKLSLGFHLSSSGKFGSISSKFLPSRVHEDVKKGEERCS